MSANPYPRIDFDFVNNELISDLINLSFAEDFKESDITSHLCIDNRQLAVADMTAKEEGIFCGELFIPVLVNAYNNYVNTVDEQNIKLIKSFQDGDRFKAGDCLCRLSGSTINLLTFERTLLNFIQRLCGVATNTNLLVKAAGKNKILDTRKSLPGHRLLDKYAVMVGGGINHRQNLSAMVLVKNNHIDALSNDFAILATKLSSVDSKNIPIEVEVRNDHELTQLLNSFLPDVIMLDNFTNQQIVEAVQKTRLINKDQKIEVSGGMNLERIKQLSLLVDDVFISVGSIFTKVNNIDISLKIIPDTLKLLHFNQVASTQNEARKLLQGNDFVCVVSDMQTEGRGRSGSKWESVDGNLFCTIGLTLNTSIEKLQALSMVVGLSIMKTLSLDSYLIRLKWPNDLIYLPTKQKLAGILLESTSNNQSSVSVLIGIGINLISSPNLDLATNLNQVTNGLVNIDQLDKRLSLATELSRQVKKDCEELIKNGFSVYKDEWLQKSIHQYKDSISLKNADLLVEGYFDGISSNGAIIINTIEGRKECSSGHLLSW